MVFHLSKIVNFTGGFPYFGERWPDGRGYGHTILFPSHGEMKTNQQARCVTMR
jgi:hypothetical protein